MIKVMSTAQNVAGRRISWLSRDMRLSNEMQDELRLLVYNKVPYLGYDETELFKDQHDSYCRLRQNSIACVAFSSNVPIIYTGYLDHFLKTFLPWGLKGPSLMHGWSSVATGWNQNGTIITLKIQKIPLVWQLAWYFWQSLINE